MKFTLYTYKAILLCIFYIEPPVLSNQSRFKINQHQDTTQQSHQVSKPQGQKRGSRNVWPTNTPKMVCIWVVPKIVVPQIIHFNRVFHYRPSILGYPYFWKHLCMNLEDHPSLPRTCKWLIINNLQMAWAYFSMGGGWSTTLPPGTWKWPFHPLEIRRFHSPNLEFHHQLLGVFYVWPFRECIHYWKGTKVGSYVTFGYISIFQKELFFGVPG